MADFRLGAALLVATLAGPLTAQDVQYGEGAEIRALDKITGDLADITILVGQTMQIGRLEVELTDCRFQAQGEGQVAYAFFNIGDPGMSPAEVFSGWMSADSPALNPLDHPRYDVWLIRCKSAATE